MAAPQTEVLITVDGTERGRYLFRPGDYIIGREEGCHIRVEAELVSRRHAKLVLNYDHALIEDLGSSNGTRVNDQPVTDATRLWPNQKIHIGTATIELRRLKVEVSDQSLMPTQSVVRRVLPEEFLREKKYDIGKVIAQGGMGAILDAKEATIERTVAMKVMLDTNSSDDLLRFLNEAKITGQLEHPNIVPVHELSVDENGQPYYTMKMVRGITLKKVLDLMAAGTEATVKKYPLPALLTIFQKVCDALAFAHSKGVLHRDLKPENIMLGDYGEVLVVDWGLAKRMTNDEGRMTNPGAQDARIKTVRGTLAECGAELRHSASDLRHSPVPEATLAGSIMGTPQYMAPEQARGEIETLDHRADIYALGAILYHILARRPAVAGQTAMEVVEKVGRGEVARLPTAGHPDSLVAVVHKAMAHDRNQRYANVADLQADIAAYQGGFATSAERAGLARQLFLAVMRHKAVTAAALIALVTGVGFGTQAILEGRRAERGEAAAKATLAELKKTAPTLLALADTEAGFQRFDSALVKLDAALALDPDLTAGYWRRAWLLLGMARYGEAPAALRLAKEKDPNEEGIWPKDEGGRMKDEKTGSATSSFIPHPSSFASLLPVLDAIAAAPDDATRFPPERTEALFRHFTKVGASGELNALSQRLTLGAEQKKQMVRKRLDEWLGKGVGKVEVQPDGTIELNNLPKATDTLEPLRGLPIGSIYLGSTAVKSLEPLRGLPIRRIELTLSAVNSLEPLRGMALTRLKMSNTRIADLSPLRGMPIIEFIADGSDISDLTPLAGMPLRRFSAPQNKIADIAPLRGAPLEEVYVGTNRIVDLSLLRGAPIKKVLIGGNQCSDLAFLADSPALEYLDCLANSIADLTPLRGKPLKFLGAGRNRIADLRPLAGLPLTELTIDNNPITDYAPLRELRLLQKLRISDLRSIKVSLEPLRQHPSLQYIAAGFGGPYRPAAEFWADYDAQQATQKK